jgi:hypothetical protein
MGHPPLPHRERGFADALLRPNWPLFTCNLAETVVVGSIADWKSGIIPEKQKSR